METIKSHKTLNKIVSITLIIFMLFGFVINIDVFAKEKIVYPLKMISKLECRFEDFWALSSKCKQNLPILRTKDYKKYIKLNWWYNDYTRLYTVLWGWSYKYGWDVWNGWHVWVDIATAKWTPIYAMADWKVIISKRLVSYWNNVTIEHKINWKRIFSTYAHMSKILVKKWKIVKAWEKIWEVWSTWNSTWNHLHFQIDLDTPFHPYYYDYEKCPYSYSKISETWVCFSELKKNTIDPLLFLETNWWVLDNIKIQKISRDDIWLTKKTTSIKKTANSYDYTIFDRTVYFGYPKRDIIEVQHIFRDLWEYDGPISWKYEDIEKDIIKYQLANNIIDKKTDLWAWRFGPKTRKQAKHDYKNFLDNWWKRIKDNEATHSLVVENNVKVEVISNKWMLSREEIEAKEVDTFLRRNNVNLKLDEVWWNIKLWWTIKLKLDIKSKSWKKFKWNLPASMTFTVDSTKINVFPTKLYYFTDWKRDIKLTWLKTGETTLYVKIWAKVIKKFKLNVYSSWKTVYPEFWKIYTNKNIVLSDKKTWIILFKDKNWKKLINFRYGWEYVLKASEWMEVCIKKWQIKDISRIYKKDCDQEDYKNELKFTYDDTVWWLLLFDYKVYSKDINLKLLSTYKNKLLANKKIYVVNPKGLKKDYVYKDEVIDLLSKWILTWINKWYFLEERWLVESDAIAWIWNTLIKMKEDVIDKEILAKIDNNIKELIKKRVSRFNTISREEFLDLSYKYLVFNKNNYEVSIKYRDLENKDNLKANAIFDKNNTWKDRFGDNYYRPKVQITRWEWAYFLAKVIERNKKVLLTLK